jgi:nucleotide-binding universal stress UspA family protein
MKRRRAMRVVMSGDRNDEGAAAREWCRTHLHPGDSVIAVVGINPVGELVMGLPVFDAMGDEHALRQRLEREHCEPLRRAGLDAQLRVLAMGQAHAVLETAVRERADLLVVGKHPRGPVGDIVWGEVATHVAHHPPCPVVIVPVGERSPQSAVA